MNIIFLDVDGPLAYSEYENNKTANIDPEKVKLLKEICDKGNAFVVISSSWKQKDKYNKRPRIYYTLTNILQQFGITVLGDTPDIPAEYEGDAPKIINLADIEKLPKHKYGTGRAAEVNKYIIDNKVDNFVILDDEDYDWSDYSYETHWVQPSWFGNGGLKPEHVEQAIKILKGEF